MNLGCKIMQTTNGNIIATASDEQKIIINSPDNLIINSVAGSGKTTTILFKAMSCPNKRILQLTFNAMLCKDVRKRVKAMGITNLEIHTYHSLAVKYYLPNAYNDEGITNILAINLPLTTTCPPLDFIFMDEAQDMTITYMKFIKKFMGDSGSENATIWSIGEKQQAINAYRGANFMFLTKAGEIWNKPFSELCLTTSFRLTIPMVNFINKIMYGDSRLNAIKDGERVDYWIGNSFDAYKSIGNSLVKGMKRGIYKPEDIFVISPSIKSANAPFLKLENYLVLHGIPCLVPTSDDMVLTDEVIGGKVAFTTIHQTKGRERKVAICYGFDESYFKYYLKNGNELECPNTLYVMVTRASHKLVVIHDGKFKALPFLKLGDPAFATYVHFIDEREQRIVATNFPNPQNTTTGIPAVPIKHVTVTELVKFISDDVMNKVMPIVDNIFICIRGGENVADIPTKITVKYKNRVTQEDVSEINGITIPSMYEKQTNPTNTSASFIEEFLLQWTRGITDENLKEYAKRLVLPCVSIRDYLFASNFYVCATMGIYSKLAQIKSYNWLKKSHVAICFANMAIMDGKKVRYEIEISNEGNPHLNTVISGRMDAMCDEHVYEFKCVSNLTIEHKLQLVIYEWLYRMANYKEIYGNKHFLLLNIRTGEMLQLNRSKGNRGKIDEIVDMLIRGKFMKNEEMGEDEFLEMVNEANA
jgi:hypothetical protein